MNISKQVYGSICCAIVLTGCGGQGISNKEASEALERYHTENPICLNDGTIYFPLDSHLDRNGNIWAEGRNIPTFLLEALQYDGLVSTEFKDIEVKHSNRSGPLETKTIPNTHWDWINSRVDENGALQAVANKTYDSDRETLCLPITGPFEILSVSPTEGSSGSARSKVNYEYSISRDPMWPHVTPKNGITAGLPHSLVTAWGDQRSHSKMAEATLYSKDGVWFVLDANPMGDSEQVRALSQLVPEEELRQKIPKAPKKASLCNDEEIKQTRANIAKAKKEDAQNRIPGMPAITEYDYIVNPENCYSWLAVTEGTGTFFDVALDSGLDMTDPLVFGEYFASVQCKLECMSVAKKRSLKEIRDLDPSAWRLPPTGNLESFPIEGLTDPLSTASSIFPDELSGLKNGVYKVPVAVVKAIRSAEKKLGKAGYIETLLSVADKAHHEALKSQYTEYFYSECLVFGVNADLSGNSQEFTCINEN